VAQQKMFSSLRVLFLLLLLLFVSDVSISKLPPRPAGSSTAPPVIVIGFVGGFVRHDDRVHTEIQLADRLREEYASGISVQTFENHRGKEAHKAILRLLDANGDGTLSPAEKQNARVIIFGHSWGASETVELARQLEKDGVPVVLTIQVDSVHKIGEDDALIPANVSQAVNFYQLDGLLHGLPEIRAADPARTHILGNFRSDYKAKPMTCGQYPWYDRLIMKPHIQIECDPAVWTQVESLIRSNLSLEARVPPPNEVNSSGSPFKNRF
jgi:pimeloyl-ACP methyl ester carboxylesterase